MSIDSQLLNKYNVAGPRYTSYPTVPFWEDTPTEGEWAESLGAALTAANGTNVGAALYIHIPFCRRLCTYCGCNNRITRKPGVAEPYVKTLLKEYELYRAKLGIDRLPISEIHLGGGTPTYLTPDELNTLITGILENAELLDDVELRGDAIRGLAGFGNPKTPTVLLGAYDRFTPEQRTDAIQTLATRPNYATALLDAVESSKAEDRRIPRNSPAQFGNIAASQRACTDRLMLSFVAGVNLWNPLELATGRGCDYPAISQRRGSDKKISGWISNDQTVPASGQTADINMGTHKYGYTDRNK